MKMAIDKLDSYEGRKTIARMLREWHMRQPRREHTWAQFTRGLALTPETISRLASEDTKAPRLHTVLMAMKGLGFAFVRFEEH